MTKIKSSGNIQCWLGYTETESLVRRWWECEVVQPLWKTIWQFPHKLNINLPYVPAIPLLEIYQEK